MTAQHQQGFTLLELLIVISIIGIVTAVGLPAYQNYIERMHVTLALAEITYAKLNIEENLAQGLTEAQAETLSSDIASSYHLLGLTGPSTLRCSQFEVDVNVNGAASVACTLNGSAKINGLKIQWLREPALQLGAPSQWLCKTSVRESVSPKGCVPNTPID